MHIGFFSITSSSLLFRFSILCSHLWPPDLSCKNVGNHQVQKALILCSYLRVSRFWQPKCDNNTKGGNIRSSYIKLLSQLNKQFSAWFSLHYFLNTRKIHEPGILSDFRGRKSHYRTKCCNVLWARDIIFCKRQYHTQQAIEEIKKVNNYETNCISEVTDYVILPNLIKTHSYPGLPYLCC